MATETESGTSVQLDGVTTRGGTDAHVARLEAVARGEQAIDIHVSEPMKLDDLVQHVERELSRHAGHSQIGALMEKWRAKLAKHREGMTAFDADATAPGRKARR